MLRGGNRLTARVFAVSMRIRAAIPAEVELLNSIAWVAKGSTAIDAQLEAWRADLSQPPQTYGFNPPWSQELEHICRLCRLQMHTQRVEFEHMWVHPH